MAKKKTAKKDSVKLKKSAKKKASSKAFSFDSRVLPQNIVAFGDRVEENKNIYILQSVYKSIHKFTKNKTVNESGGMLIGYTLEEFGKTNIVICGFIEAKYCDATPTTLKFTHETWEYVHREMESKFRGGKIVGWIHTHPDFGIFLSEYDTFIHENFFSEDYQVAYVVDPIQNIEGFYFWINGKIERCKGFYVFDKTGVQINVSESSEKEVDRSDKISASTIVNSILIAILATAVAVLGLICISLNGEIKDLKKDNEELSYAVQQYEALFYSSYFQQAPIEDGTAPVQQEDTGVYPDEEIETSVVTEGESTDEEVFR